MADAGLRLTVEGEKEFRAALAEIDAAVKNNQKSMKLLTEEFKLNETGMKDASAGFGSMADAAQILADKGKVLADSVAKQSEKVELLKKRVEEASETYGEHDKATEALRGQLLDAQVALTKLTNEQEKNRQAIEDAKSATGEYDKAVAELEAQLAANEAELKAMGGGLDALKKEYSELEKESGSLEAATGGLEKSTGLLGKIFGTTASGAESLGKTEDALRASEENLGKQNEALRQQNEKLADSVSKQRDLIDKLAAAQKAAAERYGEGSREAETYRKKLADATGQLDAMERELQDNKKAIEANNQAIEQGGEAPNKMLDGLKQIEEMTGIKIPGGIEKMISGFDGGTAAVGGIVTVLASVAMKMQEIFEETMQWSEDLTTKAAELDLDTEQYQELEYIALKAGTNVGGLESALTKVSTKAGEAALAQAELSAKIAAVNDEIEDAARHRQHWSEMWQETGNDAYLSQIELWTQKQREAEEALAELEAEFEQSSSYFEELGISIYDANGNIKDSLTLLYDLVDAYAEIDDATIRAAKMSELLGKSYKSLLPFIGDGADQLRNWAREAHECGYVIEHGLVSTMNNASIQGELIKKRWDVATKQAAAEFLTAGDTITGVIDGVSTALEGLSDVMDMTFGKSSSTLKGIGGAIGSSALSILNPVAGIISAFTNLSKWISGSYASGTNYAPGGLSVVGERGPEIVDLPRGSKVYPNGTAPELAGGTVYETNTYNVTIDAKNVEEFNDIVRIAQGARVGMRRG